MIDRLLTVRDVMEIIPLGKTKVTAIINELPHINTGKKLLVDRKYIESWIAINMVSGKPQKAEKIPRKRIRVDDMTKDGLIPYRNGKNNVSV